MSDDVKRPTPGEFDAAILAVAFAAVAGKEGDLRETKRELRSLVERLYVHIDRVKNAIRTINRYHDLGDAAYVVRDLDANVRSLRSDQSSWEGAVVTEYSAAVEVLRQEGVFDPEASPKPDAAPQPNGNAATKTAAHGGREIS